MRAIVVFLFVTFLSPAAQAYDPIGLKHIVELDDVSALESLINAGEITVNEQIAADHPDYKMPILAIAARAGSVRVAKFLIANKADLNAATSMAETPLMLASYFSDDQFDKSLYEIHEEIAYALMDAGANLENVPGKHTPISYAAFDGHVRIIKRLLERGAKVDSDAVGDIGTAYTALFYSAYNGHENQARILLEHGANPRIVFPNGMTALMMAKKKGHRGIAGMLECALSLAPGQRFADFCR